MADLANKGVTDVVIKEHLWSGANAIDDRYRSGRALADRILSDQAEDLSRRSLIVGHSHGGSVAVQALQFLSVYYLSKRDQLKRVSIVTLATPFTYLVRPENGKWNYEFLFAGFLPLSMAVFHAFLVPGRLPWALVLLAALVALGVFFHQLRILAKYAGGGIRPVVDICDKTADGALPWSEVHLLVLRGIDDEAAFALAVSSFAAWLGRLMRSAVLMPLRACIGPVLLLTLALIAMVTGCVLGIPSDESDRLLSSIGEGWTHRALYFFAMIFGMLAVSGVLSVFVVLVQTVVGRELVRFPNVEISVNSVPDNMGEVSVATLSRFRSASTGMRHSLYDEEDCTFHIARFLNERVGFPLQPVAWQFGDRKP
jgi:hypothetical protein